MRCGYEYIYNHAKTRFRFHYYFINYAFARKAKSRTAHVIYLLVFGGILEESIFDLSEIKNMYVESDGGFSIEKYNTAYPLKEYDYQIYELIKNNEINTETLKHINHDEHWLFKQLEKRQITTINDVFYADWSFDRGIHIIKYK